MKEEKPVRSAEPAKGKLKAADKKEDKSREVKTSSEAKSKAAAAAAKTTQSAPAPKAGKMEKPAVKQSKDADVTLSAKTTEPQAEENVTAKKKPGQRYFQCVFVGGKNAQYPLRPFTPAMPLSMPPAAMRAMMEQHRARAAGQ